MIYNFWVWMDTGFADEVRAKFMLSPPPLGDGPVASVSVAATTHPLINSLNPTLPKLFKGKVQPVGWDVWNCYIDVDDLSDIVPLREGLQELEFYYPDYFRVLGAWEYEGQPIGGVGSPWFPSPPDFLDFMPSSEVEDVVLLAGQHQRSFV